MPKKWNGGHRVAVERYLSNLEDERLKGEEAAWNVLDENIACPQCPVEERVIQRRVLEKFSLHPSKRDTAVALKHAQGYTYEEIGQNLGISIKRVGQLNERARLTLKEIMFEEGVEL